MTKYTKPSWLRTNNSARPKWVQDQDDKPRHKTMLYHGSKTGLYESRRWRKARKNYFSKRVKDQNNKLIIYALCEKCQYIGITSAAHTLDHIIPIRQGGAIWDESNWMALCENCHNIKRGKERHNKYPKAKQNKNGELIPIDRHELY